MKKLILILLTYVICNTLFAQNQPDTDTVYYEISGYPVEYNAGSLASRLVDGLGFRFYWATKDLREQDLTYRPTDESRSISEDIDHINGLVVLTVKSIGLTPQTYDNGSFTAKRSVILKNISMVSNLLANSNAKDFEHYNIKFSNGMELPFWNLVNGPIADAIWHCGQIAMMRRTSGNPISPHASFLTGKVSND